MPLADQTALPCTYSPHDSGVTYPTAVGMTWSGRVVLTCEGQASVAFDESGSMLDEESMTLVASTFTALKIQDAVSWTASDGTTYTQTTTEWRETKTGALLKSIVDVRSASSSLASHFTTTTMVVESFS